jgi:long-chain fatty acid transport protein
MQQISRALALLGLLLVIPPARADESNFRRYIVGGRAAGMGGAFTALADDGSGPYYNPGGLAFVQRSMLSLSASVYGLARGSLDNGLGVGHNFDYSTLNIFPVSTSAVTKFGTADPSGAQQNAVALSVFVPDAWRVNARDTLGSNDNAFLRTVEDQTVWAGVTCARRFDGLGVGAGVFALVETGATLLDFRRGTESAFTTVTARSNQTIVGVVGSVGLRYDLTENLKIGASLYTPELGIFGSREAFVRSETNAGSPVVSPEDLHATPSLPWRAQAGIAWTSGELTLTADAIVLGSRETLDDVGLEGLDRRVKRNMVVNGSAGLEYVISDKFPVRAGVFTDFAASDPPGVTWSNTSHMNRYGVTTSIGHRTEHTSTDVGLNVSYATGEDLRPNDLSLKDVVVAGSTETLLYLFLATSYQF